MFSFYEIVLPSVCFFFIDYPSIKREFLKIYGFILTLSCYFRSWNSRYSLAHSTLFPPLSRFEGREEGSPGERGCFPLYVKWQSKQLFESSCPLLMFKTKDYIPRVSSRDRCRKNKLPKETIAVKVAFAIKFSCAKTHYIAPVGYHVKLTFVVKTILVIPMYK